MIEDALFDLAKLMSAIQLNPYKDGWAQQHIRNGGLCEVFDCIVFSAQHLIKIIAYTLETMGERFMRALFLCLHWFWQDSLMAFFLGKNLI